MSRKVWYCAKCGYEVAARGRCFSCGERLVASPLPELESGPQDDEVGYRLDQWDDQTRAALIRMLILAGVPHRFEEEELVVLAVDEPEVDRLVARASGDAAGEHEASEELDEAGSESAPLVAGDAGASRALYEAAARLREDPTDMQADVALAEASAAIFSVDYLPELDQAHMAAVGRVTRRLLGALGADEALEDEIKHQADVLCRLIAPSVGPGATDEEAKRALARLEGGAKQSGRQVELPQSEVTPGGEMATAGEVHRAAGEDGAAGSERAEALGPAASNTEPSQAGAVVAEAPEVGHAEPVEPEEEPGALDGLDGLDELEEDEDTGELVFELGEWLPEQRVELSMLLESAGIAYNWEGSDLTVAEEHEREVDGLFQEVHGLLDDDDEARYRAIEELFGSVDRLANDPASEERQHAFLQAVGAVELPTPVGVDDAFWWRVRSQGHALVAALEGDARADEVSREAAVLAEMLHEMV